MDRIQGLIFDIDGVLEYQGMVYPGAIDIIHQLREDGYSLRFLTNSTLKSRQSCARKLADKGFQIEENEVFTASFATATYLANLHPRSIWVMLAREGLDEFGAFVHDRHNPEYIVVGDYRQDFSFDNLNHALRLLAAGAKLIGMQAELIDGSSGDLELNVGSWVGLLERASGVNATFIGKPARYAFDLAIRSLALELDHILMVGDRLSTDIQGAIDANIHSVLLKTGEYKYEDINGNIKPDWVIDGIHQLPQLLAKINNS